MPPTKEQIAQVAPFREPSAFYVTGEDNIRVASLNSVSGVQVTITGRMLTLDGRIAPFTIPHSPNADRTVRNQIHILGEGWIQNLSAVVTAGAPLYGQTWIRVEVVRGSTGAVEPLAVLMQGCVTAVQKIAFPGTPVHATHERPGAIRSVTGTDPAAGAEVTETVPAGARWRLLQLSTVLATDATVSNREARIILDDGTTQYFESGATAVVAASASAAIVLWRGSFLPSLSSTLRGLNAPEYIILLAGHRIRTETSNLQAGDNYGAPQLLIEEWLEGA